MTCLKNAAPLCLLALLFASTCALCQTPSIRVDVAHPGARISPTLYGIFFEEINHAGDGGIYAEMISNRSFEAQTTVDWSLETTGAARASMALDTSKPLNQNNKASLRLDISRAGNGAGAAIVNDGYWGIAVQKGAKYHLSFFARSADFKGVITAKLVAADGKVY
jgi:alpha-N-arabinofuranosidase